MGTPTMYETPEADRLVTTPWPGTLEARITELLQAGEHVVLVTVVASHGSAPRHAGTRALQTQHGFEGTVGGGILEAQAMRTARQCLADGQSRRCNFSLDPADPRSDMICGGDIEVFCEALTPEQASMFATADAILREGGIGLWTVDSSRHEGEQKDVAVSLKRCLHVQPGDVTPGPSVATDFETAKSLLHQGNGCPGLVITKNGDIYVEPLDAPPVLLLCGGGHVSLEVARLAHACGFVVDVADDREEFANAERFPMARRCLALPGFTRLVESCAVGPRHFVAIMTRGHAFDREVLEQVLTSRARYVGMIGSRSKRERVFSALLSAGVTEAKLASVHCPIGLDIKAETPQQIAVSVVAELLTVKGNVVL
ncbi:MAG: XdhC family protein [Desulfovibrio sp.]|nr:XdhC family protein [Desulfovibrio sp.]